MHGLHAVHLWISLADTQCSSIYGTVTVQDENNINCRQNCTSRKLDLQESVVRTADFSLTQEIVTEECWTRTLDNTFIRNFETDRTRTNSLRWQYIGTPTGFYRILPGVTSRNVFLPTIPVYDLGTWQRRS